MDHLQGSMENVENSFMLVLKNHQEQLENILGAVLDGLDVSLS